MSVNLSIYNNVAGLTKTCKIDFIGGDVFVPTIDAEYDATIEYFITLDTNAQDTASVKLPTKVVRYNGDLALNHLKRSQSDSNTAYASIKDSVDDMIFDLINGHTANQFTSGCTAQLPMKWT